MKNAIIENKDILNEIFIVPSLECIEDRFTGSAEAAGCLGKCESGGGCKAMA